jgi:23S rRNA (cytosine1962-C5)-methyltransferase
VFDLESAWAWRESLTFFSENYPLRVFYGPGEGKGDLQYFAIDRFGDHYWITEWESQLTQGRSQKVIDLIISFLKKQGAKSIVGLSRPERGVAPESKVFYGSPPSGRFVVQENDCQFWIQFEATRHPGLFLDHEPLRRWLRQSMKGLSVLNTFAYTGSLSVAASRGGAKQVTTLDLSKATVQWAQENSLLNQFPQDSQRFISGDVFEWLPRLKREGQKYDCIILDPPSFSHGKQGRFSTAKDLEKLHSLAMELLSERGLLITSINSANVSWKKYEADLLAASKSKKMEFSVVKQIDLPETFPTRFGMSSDRYLKGWILRRLS